MGFCVLWGGIVKLNKDIHLALKGNRWIERITESQIVYTYEFKVLAIEEFLRGVSAEEIFRSAEIPLNFLKPNYARDCLKRWLVQYRKHGLESLKVDKRGTTKGPTMGRPRKHDRNLTYEELKVIVEIQSEVIEALKKKKALAKQK
jgi:hypothetical protein